MSLDLTSIKKAAVSLESAIRVSCSPELQTRSLEEQEVVRAGVIQNFEFTYELCWKFMKRWLSENYSQNIADSLIMKDLFRVAGEKLLIRDVELWFEFHKKRNRTSHTYNVVAAHEVYSVALTFLAEVQDFISRIEARNG